MTLNLLSGRGSRCCEPTKSVFVTLKLLLSVAPSNVVALCTLPTGNPCTESGGERRASLSLLWSGRVSDSSSLRRSKLGKFSSGRIGLWSTAWETQWLVMKMVMDTRELSRFSLSHASESTMSLNSLWEQAARQYRSQGQVGGAGESGASFRKVRVVGRAVPRDIVSFIWRSVHCRDLWWPRRNKELWGCECNLETGKDGRLVYLRSFRRNILRNARQ